MAIVESARRLRDTDDRAAQHFLRVTHRPGEGTSQVGGKLRIAIVGEVAADAALVVVVGHDLGMGK